MSWVSPSFHLLLQSRSCTTVFTAVCSSSMVRVWIINSSAMWKANKFQHMTSWQTTSQSESVIVVIFAVAAAAMERKDLQKIKLGWRQLPRGWPIIKKNFLSLVLMETWRGQQMLWPSGAVLVGGFMKTPPCCMQLSTDTQTFAASCWLAYGSNVNLQNYAGKTPLYTACQEGHLLCVLMPTQ